MYVPYIEFAPYVLPSFGFRCTEEKKSIIFYSAEKKNPIFDRRLNIGEKGDPVQAEPDLFCYERFEDWASKLRKRNVRLSAWEERRMVVFDYYIIPPPPLLLLLRRRRRSSSGSSSGSSSRQLRVNFLIGLESIFTFLDILWLAMHGMFFFWKIKIAQENKPQQVWSNDTVTTVEINDPVAAQKELYKQINSKPGHTVGP